MLGAQEVAFFEKDDRGCFDRLGYLNGSFCQSRCASARGSLSRGIRPFAHSGSCHQSLCYLGQVGEAYEKQRHEHFPLFKLHHAPIILFMRVWRIERKS